jgi:hypothetical protein
MGCERPKVNQLNSFGNQEFLNDLLSAPEVGRRQTQTRSNATELADPLAAHGRGATSADLEPDLVLSESAEESHLNQILEDARFATGASGAAIALVQGKEIVCRATSGPDAPNLGTCLDPRTGLSGSCIQTRQRQQCNDTLTDPRVDSDACRSLGVRSVVVLPLMHDGELVGIFEILSCRPNAFGQRDLYNLQTLTGRILESRRWDGEATATTPQNGSGSLLKSEDVASHNKSHPSASDSKIPRRERTSKRNDVWTPVLGVLVIGAAVLLGTLVGWRLGSRMATLEFRHSSPFHRAGVASRIARTDHIVVPAKELQTDPAPYAESGGATLDGPVAKQGIAGGTNLLWRGGGITVPQGGRVIFRLPAPAALPTRDSQTSQHVPSLEPDSTQR